MAILENRAGSFVAPSEAAALSAMADTGDGPGEDPANFLADPSGLDAYPIVTLTWVLLNDRPAAATKDRVLKEFLAWGLTNGQAMASGLGYLPLPETISTRALRDVAGSS